MNSNTKNKKYHHVIDQKIGVRSIIVQQDAYQVFEEGSLCDASQHGVQVI